MEREPQQFQPAPETSFFHPPERKTKLMTQIENKFVGQPIEEVLFHFYWQQTNSARGTAEAIEINRNTIFAWFRKCGIRLRSKSEAGKIPWQDPERKEEILKKRETPLTRLKRSQATRAQWKNLRGKMMEARKKAIQTMRRRREKRLEEQIGQPIKEYLKEAKEQGLSKTEVCSHLKIGWGTLNGYLEREGVEWSSAQELLILMEWEKRKQSPEMKLVEKAKEEGVFSDLSEREQIILNGRFPKEGDEPKSLPRLGRKFGITRQRVFTIQNGAIEKIRLKLESI